MMARSRGLATAPPVARRNPAATRQAILNGAAELFARKGFDGAGLREIANRAGVAKGSIHHHFGSKEALYVAVLDRFRAGFSSRFREALEGTLTGDPVFEEGFGAYFEFLAANPDVVRVGCWTDLFLADHPDRGARLAAETDSAEGDFRFLHESPRRASEAIAVLQRRGAMRADLDPDLILAAIWCLAEHWHQARARWELRLDRPLGKTETEAFRVTVAKILRTGLQPPGAASSATGNDEGRSDEG